MEEAVTEAVRYSIDHGIMKEYLLSHGSEVVNMLSTSGIYLTHAVSTPGII
jgi:hypothetical protein